MTGPKPYPSILQGFGLILVAIIYTLLFTLLSKLVTTQFGINTGKDTFYKSIEGLLSYIIPIGATFFFALKQRKRAGIIAGISFKPFSLTVFTLSFAVIMCMGFMVELFQYYVPVTDSFIKLMEDVMSNDAYSVLTAVVAAPILEELLMRGIILDGFLKRYSPAKSIVLSALIFGVFHLNPWQAFAGFAIGLLLGWLYWKTQSLLLCILLHAANNASAVLEASYFDISETPTMVDYMGVANYMIVFSMALILLIGCMRLLHRHFKKQVSSVEAGELPM